MYNAYEKKNIALKKLVVTEANPMTDLSSQSKSLQYKADLANSTVQCAEAPQPNNSEIHTPINDNIALENETNKKNIATQRKKLCSHDGGGVIQKQKYKVTYNHILEPLKKNETTTPHIKGTAKTNRNRTGNLASFVTNDVGKIPALSMTGGHLAKCSWGGEDNTMNVVAWSGKAENKWTDIFEKPIDNYFSTGGDSAELTLYVEKEIDWSSQFQDGIIPGTPYGEKTNTDSAATSSKRKYYINDADKMRINEGMEQMPIFVKGSALLGNGNEVKCELSQNEIGSQHFPTQSICETYEKRNEENSIKKNLSSSIDALAYHIINHKPPLVTQSIEDLKSILNSKSNPLFNEIIGRCVGAPNLTALNKLTEAKKAQIKQSDKDPKLQFNEIALYLLKEWKECEEIDDRRKSRRRDAIFEECLNLNILPTTVLNECIDLFYKNTTTTTINEDYKAFCVKKINNIIIVNKENKENLLPYLIGNKKYFEYKDKLYKCRENLEISDYVDCYKCLKEMIY